MGENFLFMEKGFCYKNSFQQNDHWISECPVFWQNALTCMVPVIPETRMKHLPASLFKSGVFQSVIQFLCFSAEIKILNTRAATSAAILLQHGNYKWRTNRKWLKNTDVIESALKSK